ncbi:MAG: efflux RND transporter periplasmic adaptor subunit, partial [Armatimonadota bacterium]
MKKWIAIAVAVVIIAGAGYWYYRSRTDQTGADEIQTATVERGDLRVTVTSTGVLEPLTTVEVKSRSGGEIRQLFVEAGDYVKKGDIIAQLDPTDLETQMDKARASMTSADARAKQSSYNAQAQKVDTSTGIAESQAALETQRARLRQAEGQLEKTKENVQHSIAQAESRLKSQRINLREAQENEKLQPTLTESQIRQAEASLRRSEQDLATLESGNRPQEIAQAKARVTEAETVLANAKINLRRQKQLLEKGFVSQQEVDSAQQSHDTAVSQLESARQAYDLVVEGPRKEDIEKARADVEQSKAALKTARAQAVQIDIATQRRKAAEAAVEEAEASLKAARAERRDIQIQQDEVESARRAVVQAEQSLKRARAQQLQIQVREQDVIASRADVRSAQASLEDVRYNFEHTTVEAPRDGVILEKHVEEGTILPAGTAALAQGTAIVTIADITEMYVMADVDEVDISKVKLGQPVDINVETIERARITGTVNKIYPQGTAEENVIYYKVRVKIDELRPELRPGMTADLSITTTKRKDVLLVPDAAIDRSREKPVVQVLPSEGAQPADREVKVGVTDYLQTVVLE